ncbi:MAG TPA: NAD(P)/FAD-dependent oxidoreductase [Thermoanaerobaculia bacterium]|nr:NAD(P)/FAD-dependent oxidoreductase [Thermoanaerobaculia bacterium]
MDTRRDVNEANGNGGAPRVAVVGAGLAGSLAALFMAREGYRVDLYERNPDMRRESVPGPSMNLGLSRRGLESLSRVGLAERVLARAIPMTGRVVHRLGSGDGYQAYGGRQGGVINAIKRGDINITLLDALDDEPGVETHFERRLLDLDRDAPGGVRLVFEDRAGGRHESEVDFVVGADGVHSAVRDAIHRGERADFQRTYLDWGWKELTIPAETAAGVLAGDAFHLWPRGGSMVFAHPNLDGTFTCSFVLPFEGPVSFASLSTPEAVRALFAESFPSLSRLVPDLVEQFEANPVIPLVSVRTWPWTHGDRVVLIGDAAHAVVPFMAQGMNAGFEDCRLLVEALRSHRDRAAAFAAFARHRKPHSDALEEMSRANFTELRDRVRSPVLHAHKWLDTQLEGLLGEQWMTLHARVTHTTMPYAEARRRAKRQDALVGAAVAGLGVVGLLGLGRWLGGRG